jgi:hypothetical protein
MMPAEAARALATFAELVERQISRSPTTVARYEPSRP